MLEFPSFWRGGQRVYVCPLQVVENGGYIPICNYHLQAGCSTFGSCHGALSLYMYLSLFIKKRAVGISETQSQTNCYLFSNKLLPGDPTTSSYDCMKIQGWSFQVFLGGGRGSMSALFRLWRLVATFLSSICKLDAAPLEVAMVPSLSICISLSS